MAKHLNTAFVVDSGRSAWAWWQAPKHDAQVAEWEPPTEYSDVWAGNPDTDKFWAKGE